MPFSNAKGEEVKLAETQVTITRFFLDFLSTQDGELTTKFQTYVADHLSQLDQAIDKASSDKITGLKEYANGELDQIIETGKSASSLADMVQNSTQLVHSNVSSTSKLAEEIAGSVSSVSAAAEEFTATASVIDEQLARNVDAATKAQESTDAANEGMQELNETNGQITQFIDIIKNIASQTNLLALNATIEAARAGEAGRGFAVVASEVKTLAKNSADAAEQVERQIAAMNSAVNRVSASLSGIIDTIGESAQQTAETQHTVSEQNAAASEITRNLAMISTNADEINSGMSRSLGEISKTNQNLIRMISEMTYMHDQVVNLRGLDA